MYFGVGRLNMRSRSASNFTPEDLAEVVRICREAGVPVVNYGMLLAAAGGLGEVRADGTVETGK